MAIDTHTLMHLHQDPTKYPKEDFMSPTTLTVIDDAAKMREDLTWAMEARKTITGDRGSLFGNRLHKPPGGGQRIPAAHSGRGSGRGTRGKGSGKGKNDNKTVKCVRILGTGVW